MSEYKSAEQQTDTVNYQVLSVVNGTLVTAKSFWAKDDADARSKSDGVKGVLCRVIER